MDRAVSRDWRQRGRDAGRVFEIHVCAADLRAFRRIAGARQGVDFTAARVTGQMAHKRAAYTARGADYDSAVVLRQGGKGDAHEHES